MTKAQIQLISSLKLKKFRKQHGLFVVEGHKNVQELLASDFEVKNVFATETYLDENPIHNHPFEKIIPTKKKSLERASHLKNASEVLALAKIKEQNFDLINAFSDGYCLFLDEIKDPGNLGTIIRTADWFGIRAVFCSPNCVDLYNPKVVAASMGSLYHLPIVFRGLLPILEDLKKEKIPIYGTLLEGKNIREVKFPAKGICVLGNESQGISDAILPFLDEQIFIPSQGKAESLNVGIAAGVFCYEISKG